MIQRYESAYARSKDAVWYHYRCAEALEKEKARKERSRIRKAEYEASKNYELPGQEAEHLKHKVIPGLKKDIAALERNEEILNNKVIPGLENNIAALVKQVNTLIKYVNHQYEVADVQLLDYLEIYRPFPCDRLKEDKRNKKEDSEDE